MRYLRKKNPKKISELGWGGYGGKIFNLIEFKDDIVYVTGNVSIHMIDTYDKLNPFEFGFAVSPGNYDIHINGNYLYACAYDKVLRIFDISECKHEYSYPQASFEYEPLAPIAGEKVYFKDTSYPYATSFLWDFGDGQKSTLKNAVNIFLKESTMNNYRKGDKHRH